MLFAMLVFDATRGMLLAFTAGATTDLIARVVVAAGYFGTVLALAWRRSWVLVPFGLTLAGALLTTEERGVFLPLAIILAVAAYALTTWPLVVMVVSSVAWELAWRVLHDAVNGRLLWPVPFVLLLVLPGRALRVLVGRAQRERAEASVRDEAARARERALVAENRRKRRELSRELHDVVAHELTSIAMRASVAELSDDPGEHREALQAISGSARGALAEIRRLARILDSTEQSAEPSPGEGVGSLDLARELERSAGYLADLGFVAVWRLDGDPARVPPGLLPTAVTVLREATTNIVKHSSPGVRCELAIAIGDELTIEVLNELSEGLLDLPESGLGLAGLRGRMSDLHGTFRSGEHNGWWTVYATLPLHERE